MIKLIGSTTCPFVHRIRVLLAYLEQPYEFEQVDLTNKPDWFLQLLPKGLVPVLQTEDGTGIFESGVIAEYLVEKYPIVDVDLLPKVIEAKFNIKAWDAMGSQLVASFHQVMWASAEAKASKLEKLNKDLAALETKKQQSGTLFFNTDHLSLVDTAYASVFYRMTLVNTHYKVDFLAGYPALQAWSKAIMALPCLLVGHPGFEALWQQRIEGQDSWVLQAHTVQPHP